MPIFKIRHYEITFKGSQNLYFEFETYCFCNSLEDERYESPIQIVDGVLYIKGVEISNNKESFNNFLDGINDGGLGADTGHAYIIATFAIDSKGYITCVKSSHSSNKVDRFFCKYLGF